MKKRPWATPQLTVLVRGKPGERVLDFCKTLGGGGTYIGPGLSNSQCAVGCAECTAINAS